MSFLFLFPLAQHLGTRIAAEFHGYLRSSHDETAGRKWFVIESKRRLFCDWNPRVYLPCPAKEGRVLVYAAAYRRPSCCWEVPEDIAQNIF